MVTQLIRRMLVKSSSLLFLFRCLEHVAYRFLCLKHRCHCNKMECKLPTKLEVYSSSSERDELHGSTTPNTLFPSCPWDYSLLNKMVIWSYNQDKYRLSSWVSYKKPKLVELRVLTYLANRDTQTKLTSTNDDMKGLVLGSSTRYRSNKMYNAASRCVCFKIRQSYAHSKQT
jgi:hypothetical protein